MHCKYKSMYSNYETITCIFRQGDINLGVSSISSMSRVYIASDYIETSSSMKYL